MDDNNNISIFGINIKVPIFWKNIKEFFGDYYFDHQNQFQYLPASIGTISTTAIAVIPLLNTNQAKICLYFCLPLLLSLGMQYKFSKLDDTVIQTRKEYDRDIYKREIIIIELGKNIDKISSKYKEYEEEEKRTVKDVLREIGTSHLHFGSKYDSKVETNNERITAYIYDRDDNVFIPIERFSENNHYERINRRKHPADQGALREAWRQRVFYRGDYPDPVKKLDAYLDALEHEGIPRDIASNFTMKPRLIFGYRLNNQNGDPRAVIIVESTVFRRYKKAGLEEIFFNVIKPEKYRILLKNMENLLQKYKLQIDIEDIIHDEQLNGTYNDIVEGKVDQIEPNCAEKRGF